MNVIPSEALFSHAFADNLDSDGQTSTISSHILQEKVDNRAKFSKNDQSHKCEGTEKLKKTSLRTTSSNDMDNLLENTGVNDYNVAYISDVQGGTQNLTNNSCSSISDSQTLESTTLSNTNVSSVCLMVPLYENSEVSLDSSSGIQCCGSGNQASTSLAVTQVQPTLKITQRQDVPNSCGSIEKMALVSGTG